LAFIVALALWGASRIRGAMYRPTDVLLQTRSLALELFDLRPTYHPIIQHMTCTEVERASTVCATCKLSKTHQIDKSVVECD
jgi:hypothetical protein